MTRPLDKRTLDALCEAGRALELAIDAREMTIGTFHTRYEKMMKKGRITAQLRKALGKVKRAMK